MKPTDKWIRAATRRKSNFYSKKIIKEDKDKKRSILITPGSEEMPYAR